MSLLARKQTEDEKKTGQISYCAQMNLMGGINQNKIKL